MTPGQNLDATEMAAMAAWWCLLFLPSALFERRLA